MVEFLWGKCIPEDVPLGSGKVIQVPDYPHSRPSHRKLRLFACACCRRIWHLLRDPRSRTAVEVSEQYADGQATEQQLRDAGVSAEAVASTAYHAVHDPLEAEAEAAGLRPEEWVHAAWEDASFASSAESAAWDASHLRAADFMVANCMAWEASARAVGVAQNDLAAARVEQHIQADLLRCIAGNPFRRVTVDPSWLSWNDGTVVKLAQGIYDDRAFDRLPVLADALEEAGCTNADLLSHCRSEGPHVRGCWVVDLILGKQ
jgi:hypothetical protein